MIIIYNDCEHRGVRTERGKGCQAMRLSIILIDSNNNEKQKTVLLFEKTFEYKK